MSKWVRYTLEEISEKMFSGGTPSTGKDEYYDGDIPWVRTQEVNFNYINDTAIKISELGFSNSSARWVPSDSVIIAMYGNSAGRVAFSNIKTTTNQACCNFIANKEKSLPKFVFFNLLYRYKEIESMSKGAAQKNLNVGMLKALEINLPPLPTQRKIAKILSNYDDLIENNLKRIKLLEESARLTYEKWFLRFRIDGKKLEIDPETNLPFGWELVKIGSLLQRVPTTIKIKSSEILVAGRNPVVDQSTDFIAGYTNETNINKYLDNAFIVFGDHTRILKFVNFSFARGADGTQILVSNNSRMPQTLFYHSLIAANLSNYHYARHFKFLKEEKIILPDKNTANKYNDYCITIFDQIKNLRKQNQLLKEARDILLPRLMTGMIDTDDMDIAI